MVCAGVCGMGAARTAAAQLPTHAGEEDSGVRLLTVEEGRWILNAALQVDAPEPGTLDCSHLVHQIYANAGFTYPYASSFEIYAGNENFARVRFPHAGDLIVWPGHVGIVVDPAQHRFYSLVRTGLEELDYESPYWKRRGRPRFYRYKVENEGPLTAAKARTGGGKAVARSQNSVAASGEDESENGDSSVNRPPVAVSERRGAVYGPPAPPELRVAQPDVAEVPTKVIVASGDKPPTREEVAQGISEMSDALGSVLRRNDPLNLSQPVVIVEQFDVERVDVKRDHGWARLTVDSRVSLGGGAAQVKRQREKVRWELRRTESGWEAIVPTDRSYVPHDVAVRNLSAQLAHISASEGAAQHQEAVLRQEAQLAQILSALLAEK
jgi:hypothetical protein